MKLTLKRDLPLLLAALLVIWGLWYARPIGVDTLYPEKSLKPIGTISCADGLSFAFITLYIGCLKNVARHFS